LRSYSAESEEKRGSDQVLGGGGMGASFMLTASGSSNLAAEEPVQVLLDVVTPELSCAQTDDRRCQYGGAGTMEWRRRPTLFAVGGDDAAPLNHRTQLLRVVVGGLVVTSQHTLLDTLWNQKRLRQQLNRSASYPSPLNPRGPLGHRHSPALLEQPYLS
jgi:hypothetical protein